MVASEFGNENANLRDFFLEISRAFVTIRGGSCSGSFGFERYCVTRFISCFWNSPREWLGRRSKKSFVRRFLV